MRRIMVFACALMGASMAPLAPALAEKVLRIAIQTPPPGGGNPHSTTTFPSILTYAAIFDTMTRINRYGELVPVLATAWEPVDDTTWRFDLRPGVTFSNGELFNAAAVLDALDYLRTEEGAISGVGQELRFVESARVLDELTIEVKTKGSYPILPRAFATLRIPAPDRWREIGAAGFTNAPVGTGPFKVDAWTPGNIRLSAHQEGWRRPKVDRVELIVAGDSTTRLQALLSGAVDIAISVTPDDRAAIEAEGGTFYWALASGVLVISFVTTKDSPVKNPLVRRALNHAVDKQAIVDVLMGGLGRIATQPVTEETLGYNPDLEPYAYDPDKARALLAQAGYPDGFEMTIEVVPGGGSNIDTIYNQVAADLIAAGIDVKLVSITAPQLVRQIYNGGWKGEGFSMTMDTMPTLDALKPFRIHSCLWVKPWHCNERDTPLIQAALRETDLDRRSGMTRELLRRYHDDPPAIYIAQMVGYVGLAKNVRNYISDFGIIHYHELELVD